ncbi:MAG: ABC transporter substrate-binding protein [Oscillospiraceae bacterium]|nr:ABC transporter substrate-binding protein [Oscillospiraceae bacterium]
MKKLSILLAVTLLLTMSVILFAGCSSGDYDFTVGILSGSEIDAFAEGRIGFEARLTELMEEAGYTVTFDHRNANGEIPTANSIATTFAAQGVDLIFSMGTSASQAALPVAQDAEIPFVFGIITDPVGSNLVHQGSSTGSSSALPMDTQVDLLEELLGTTLDQNNRIAFLYTHEEPNSVATRNRMEAAAPAGTIVPLGIPRNGVAQLAALFTQIAGDDTIVAIYVPQDNQLVGAMTQIQNLNRDMENSLPIVVADLPIVHQGAVAALTVCFEVNGATAAELAFDILVNDRWHASFYSPSADTLTLYVNPGEAAYIGFTIPQAIINRADRVFD